MKLNIIKETPLTMSEAKEELEKIKARGTELNFRAKKTEEYLQQEARLDLKKTKELLKKLEGLEIPRLKEQHICKLADILPTTPEDVKAVLQGYAITITSDNLKKIADTIAEFISAK